jgi:hypothetical protein
MWVKPFYTSTLGNLEKLFWAMARLRAFERRVMYRDEAFLLVTRRLWQVSPEGKDSRTEERNV